MFKTIVWATDGSESADRALEYAKSLATEQGAALVVVHSEEFIVGPRVSGTAPLYADEEERKEKIAKQVQALAGEGLNVSAKQVTGGAAGAAHAIADASRELGADLIVVGTRGHTALAGLLLGSVTQRLLSIAPCPVLAVPAKTA